MIFTNRYIEPVIVFLFDHTDLNFADVVRDPVNLPNGAFAAYEETVAPGMTTATLSHPKKRCYVGIKRGGVGRLGPYLVPPVLQVYEDNAQLELTIEPVLRWINAPVVVDPNPRLPAADLAKPLPLALGYVIGVGKADVTDPSAADPLSQLPMQGWAESAQKTTRIESLLHARAFIIGDPSRQSRVVLVVADIWSGSIAIKQEVVRRLQRGNEASPYQADNIWIAGTHTHSGPAGFLHHYLYNAAADGFDAHVFECMVTGIVQAIENAHVDIGPGKVFVEKGLVPGLGRNRSLPAFNLNPKVDRDVFPTATDEEMLLLKFVKDGVKAGYPDEPVGVLTWYGLHPTNRGSKNTFVNGDHKGRASVLFENNARSIPNARKGFVAAFANACCADVSGNFVTGSASGVFDPPVTTNPVYEARMENAAIVQWKVAQQLFDQAKTPLSGPVEFRHQFIDLPKRAGVSGAVGLGMAAGSTEDGGLKMFAEGITLTDITNPSQTSQGTLALLTAAVSPVLNQIAASLVAVLNGTPPTTIIANFFASTIAAPAEMIGHFPKPIMLMTGSMIPVPFTPNILPIQLLQIGAFALLGVPG